MKQTLNTSNSLNPFNTSVQAHKERVHFTDTALLNATNPIKVHLIGAGGTGSQVATALARINHALVALGHAGLSVTLWDNDLVSPANLGRQLFSACELGMYKSTALISRINRFFGTDWRAQIQLFSTETFSSEEETMRGSIYLSCVDTAQLALERAVSCAYVAQKMAFLFIDGLHHQIDNSRRIATGIGKEDVGLGSAMKVGGGLSK
nr:ThiF family adenylyltransferase [Capnocytophaga periodontitidis]